MEFFMNEHTLYFSSPARCFEEAFPLGNGRLGIMLYGGTDKERLSLNEDTLWSGHPGQNPVPPRAKEAFVNARALAMAGEYQKAQTLLEQDFTASWTQIYLPLGHLTLTFGHSAPQHYRRVLDLQTAVASVSYQQNGIQYQRECFVSAPDNVMALTIHCSKPGALSFSLETETPLCVTQQEVQQDILLTVGRCPSFGSNFVPAEQAFRYDGESISFAQGVKIITQEGTTHWEPGRITVSNADSATILFTAYTNYNRKTGELEQTNSYIQKVFETLSQPLNHLRQKHLDDYQSLYCRTSLCLSENQDHRDLSTRLEQFSGDPGMHELLFHYGRYLTIASSRAGSQATNLQGIWNEVLLPPWSSNYTVNINTEMNYWCTYPSHLEECFEPLEQLAKRIMKNGSFTASHYYGARGIVSHHNLDLWCHTNPVGNGKENCAGYAFWNLSSGWIGCMLYESWLYHQDNDKLKTLIFPYLKEASRFYLDIMAEEEDGTFILSPSTSPENWFFKQGQSLAVAKTTTMAISIITELFTACLNCCRLLNDQELVPELTSALDRMKPPNIGADGRLLEWNEELQETDPHHRHVSHLYGLYPGHSISLEQTPELAEAVKKSLLARGDGGTGWSLAWKLNLWAKLGDAAHALKILNMQFHLCSPGQQTKLTGGGSYPNLLGAHPPFQIDSNFGVTAGIANMLLQNSNGIIKLLPAKPPEWKRGSAKGLYAYGGVTVDLFWDEKKAQAVFTVSQDKSVSILAQGKKQTLSLTTAQPFKFNWTLA